MGDQQVNTSLLPLTDDHKKESGRNLPRKVSFKVRKGVHLYDFIWFKTQCLWLGNTPNILFASSFVLFWFSSNSIVSGGNVREGFVIVEDPQLPPCLCHLLACHHHFPPGGWVAVSISQLLFLRAIKINAPIIKVCTNYPWQIILDTNCFKRRKALIENDLQLKCLFLSCSNSDINQHKNFIFYFLDLTWTVLVPGEAGSCREVEKEMFLKQQNWKEGVSLI